jgi:hypothetical protein
MVEYSCVNISSKTFSLHDYKAVRCIGATWYKNIYIWQNTVSKLRLVV